MENHQDEPREETQEETQEERAVRSLQAIFGGADLTAETTQLANEFTDRQTGRSTGWLRRRTGGPKNERDDPNNWRGSSGPRRRGNLGRTHRQ